MSEDTKTVYRHLNTDTTAKLNGAVKLLSDVDLTPYYGAPHQDTLTELLDIVKSLKTINDAIREVALSEPRDYTAVLTLDDGRTTEVQVKGVYYVYNTSGRIIFHDEYSRPLFATSKENMLYYAETNKSIRGTAGV